MVNKIKIKEIIESEMKQVADHLDRNEMCNFSFNTVYERCVDAGLFNDKTMAMFWFADNNGWLNRTYKKLNRIYQVI